MANNCACNWILVSSRKEPLQAFCDKLNTLHELPSNPDSWYGRGWLKRAAAALGVIADINQDTTPMNVKGFITPNPCLGAALFMRGDDLMNCRFEVAPHAAGFCVQFSTVSAWSVPDWLERYLMGMEAKEGITFDYKATDEFGNFHTSRNGALIGGIYEIDHEDGKEFNLGEERDFVRAIARIIGVKVTKKMLVEADRFRFDEILSLANKYNERNDEPVYINIYESPSIN